MLKLLKFILLIPAALAFECRPEGPIFPRPNNLSHAKAFRDALHNLTTLLDGAFSGRISVGWDIRNVSLSFAVVGLGQAKPSTPLWEYHHLASGNVNGTKHLDKHSQYLIGSVSKVITDAIFIRSGINMDDPVTKYLPTLRNNKSLIDWNNISLRALAGQLAGIPPNYGFSEYYYIKGWFEALGFPHLNDSSYPPCGVIGLNTECTKAHLLNGMLTSYPISPPQSRPAYSNIAYTILSYALEVATGKDYAAQLRDLLTGPLNMPSTFPSPGNDSLAVIPPVPNTWGSPYGDNAPGGGLVSTLADLTTFLHAILSRNPALASETQIRQWLQPRSFAGSRASFVGMPWEIFRPEPRLLFPDSSGGAPARGRGRGAGAGHTVTIHAKDGAAYGYRARVALLDEYGLGLVLLSAGDQTALTEVFDAALSVLVPAADAVARERARREYAGAFAGRSTAETGRVPVSAATEVDADSLRLTGLYRNGRDILASFKELWDVTLLEFLPSLRLTGVYRLYPTGIERKKALPDGRWVVEEDWRLLPDMELELNTGLPGNGISGNDCLHPWTLPDWMHYGSEPVDRLVFVKDASTGRVLGLDAPFLRTQVMKKS